MIIATTVKGVLAMTITLDNILRILRGNKADFDETRQTRSHQRVSEEGMNLVAHQRRAHTTNDICV